VPLRVTAGVTEYGPVTSVASNICSGNGVPKTISFNGRSMQYTGDCVCNSPFYGKACELRMCQASPGVYYEAEHAAVCNGGGTCNTGTGKCECGDGLRHYGEFCEHKYCAGHVKNAEANAACGEGNQCVAATGNCKCQIGGVACGRAKDDECPSGCKYISCASCNSGGRCDRNSGKCTCNKNRLVNGPLCKTPKRADSNDAFWGQSFDKWGWSKCKDGYLLTGLATDKRGTMDALYDLEVATCAKPVEGEAEDITVPSYTCYHENWWKKFDSKGGKYCRRNYFVAGLFRSHCNSLYCIEMAKCCQIKRSVWADCKWTNVNGWAKGTAELKVTPDTASFIAGFWRTETHTLDGITQIRECTPVWWGEFNVDDTRG